MQQPGSRVSYVHVQIAEPAEPAEAEAGGKRKPSGTALSMPLKKRKVGKLPKGASELLNKWQAVQKDLVSSHAPSPAALPALEHLQALENYNILHVVRQKALLHLPDLQRGAHRLSPSGMGHTLLGASPMRCSAIAPRVPHLRADSRG